MSTPHWTDTLRVGDVLETPSGDMRLVRRATYWGGKCRAISFAIRRVSWTTRGYTVYCTTDTYIRRCRLVARITRRRMTPLDQALEREMRSDHSHGLAYRVGGLP